ncbi:MAG TPA: hypothetical protein GX010_04905 [Erysipelotrichaceae bacterium]|nr:hypothetical protein [Erysipelotrichaceae bacterium]
MKKFGPTALLFGFFGLATTASLLGAVSGTLAWYAYATRATISYSGTSVQNTVQLQIGIMSEIQINDFPEDEDISEVTFEGDDHYYYFAPAGVGLTSKIINKYLLENGYATNCLYPVTSGSFAQGDDFYLKKAPNDSNYYNASAAEKKQYAKIPFVFRASKNVTAAGEYVANEELWLTDAKARASSKDDGSVYKALRLYIDRDDSYTDGDFIFNPSATQRGATKVGGLLDFDRDQYYDYEYSTNEEIIYGEYETKTGLSESGYDGSNQIVDVNGVGSTEQSSTFLAKHRSGIKYYENLNECGIKEAEYLALEDIRPIKDENNVLRNADANHPTSVCLTAGEEGHYLGRVTITVYLEGWDFSLIDEEKNHFFDIGLMFEMNSVKSN